MFPFPAWLASVHHDGSEKYVSNLYPALGEVVPIAIRIADDAPVRRVLLPTFPDGEQTPVSEVNVMAEKAGFEVRDVENLREHYALTLRHWVNRLEERHEEAVRVSDEVTYRTWRLYMSASAYGFESGNINVNQTLLAKIANGKSSIPLTRADLYA